MTTCVRCVRRCAKARGPISAIQPTNRLQTRASIEFSSLAVFVRPGANLQTRYAPRFAPFPFPRLHAQARADRAVGSPSCTAGCEPQTLQTLFSVRTVAQCCACALRIGISPVRTPFTWGICACADHNNGGDHHYRHNHHGSVTARDDGDGCDGRRLSFIQAKAQISPGGPTITLRRAPASTPGCRAGREVRARRRCDRDARRRR